jgi:Zn-dependent protease with chaperone function
MISKFLNPAPRKRRAGTALILLIGLSACGTTYELPQASEGANSAARQMFATEQAKSYTPMATPTYEAIARFHRVAARVKPVAQALCQQQMASKPDFNCDIPIVIDNEMPVRNAYMTRDQNKNSYIGMTLPLLKDARTDDEVAFVMSHEYGHLIGQHIEKSEQQAVAGMLILGVITAASQSYSTSANPYRDTSLDQSIMEDNMKLGAAVGNQAFSQSYELESDVLGAHIAKAAGYDPVEGAKFFARPEAAKTQTGNLSFWGTHPPDEKRLATVIHTAEAIKAGQHLTVRQR